MRGIRASARGAGGGCARAGRAGEAPPHPGPGLSMATRVLPSLQNVSIPAFFCGEAICGLPGLPVRSLALVSLISGELFAPFPSTSFDGGHFPRTPSRSPPPPLPSQRLSSFLPLFLTQYTETREAVVGFHSFFAVVCVRWDCESACVRSGQPGLLPSVVLLAIGCAPEWGAVCAVWVCGFGFLVALLRFLRRT